MTKHLPPWFHDFDLESDPDDSHEAMNLVPQQRVQEQSYMHNVAVFAASWGIPSVRSTRTSVCRTCCQMRDALSECCGCCRVSLKKSCDAWMKNKHTSSSVVQSQIDQRSSFKTEGEQMKTIIVVVSWQRKTLRLHWA